MACSALEWFLLAFLLCSSHAVGPCLALSEDLRFPAWGVSRSSLALCAAFNGIHHYIEPEEGVMSLCLPPVALFCSCLQHTTYPLPLSEHLRKVIASRCRFTVARDPQDSKPSLKLIPAIKISLYLQWLLLPPLPSPATKAAISLFPPRKGLSISLIFQLI